MTAKTMAEVVEALAKRNYEAEWYKGWDKCPDYARQSWIESAQETIDFLSAAGFGLVTDAKAEALEEAADWLRDAGKAGPVAPIQGISWRGTSRVESWLRSRAEQLSE